MKKNKKFEGYIILDESNDLLYRPYEMFETINEAKEFAKDFCIDGDMDFRKCKIVKAQIIINIEE